jgi:hypothetical protein
MTKPSTTTQETQELERLSGFATRKRLSSQGDTSMTKDYDGFRSGMLRAAGMARNEFKRAPDAARGEDCIWMGGYESACDHLSAVIAQAAVIDSIRVAGAQPDWQYHISLLLPDGIEDTALLKIYQVVEHELRAAAHAPSDTEQVIRPAPAATWTDKVPANRGAGDAYYFVRRKDKLDVVIMGFSMGKGMAERRLL